MSSRRSDFESSLTPKGGKVKEKGTKVVWTVLLLRVEKSVSIVALMTEVLNHL